MKPGIVILVLLVAGAAVFFLNTNRSDNGDVPVNESSGVRGVVLLGPMCPVMQNPPQEACADKPYATYATDIVAYYGKSLRVAGRTRSGEDGRFTLTLPPDGYTIRAAGETPFLGCADEWAVVPEKSFVEVQISCDGGIR